MVLFMFCYNPLNHYQAIPKKLITGPNTTYLGITVLWPNLHENPILRFLPTLSALYLNFVLDKTFNVWDGKRKI